MFGAPSTRVLEGGFWAYITDPIFLVEMFLLALVVTHWIFSRKLAPRIMKLALLGLIGGLVAFTVAFLLSLPRLQSIIAPR